MKGTLVDADALIDDYLGRLRAASWPLPASRQAELQAEVSEHIDAALADAGTRDEATVRNVLVRLGAPEDIASAEGATPATSVPTGWVPGQAAVRSWGAVEILAILFLTVGAVILPFVGPIAGLAFTWASRIWSTREKAIATGIVVVLLAVPVVALIAARLAF